GQPTRRQERQPSVSFRMSCSCPAPIRCSLAESIHLTSCPSSFTLSEIRRLSPSPQPSPWQNFFAICGRWDSQVGRKGGVVERKPQYYTKQSRPPRATLRRIAPRPTRRGRAVYHGQTQTA